MPIDARRVYILEIYVQITGSSQDIARTRPGHAPDICSRSMALPVISPEIRYMFSTFPHVPDRPQEILEISWHPCKDNQK